MIALTGCASDLVGRGSMSVASPLAVGASNAHAVVVTPVACTGHQPAFFGEEWQRREPCPTRIAKIEQIIVDGLRAHGYRVIETTRDDLDERVVAELGGDAVVRIGVASGWFGARVTIAAGARIATCQVRTWSDGADAMVENDVDDVARDAAKCAVRSLAGVPRPAPTNRGERP
jgi:hypothetical protein